MPGWFRRHENLLVNLLLVLCTSTFVLGIWAPMLTLTKLVWISNTFSVLSGTWQLASEGEYVLFALIGTFTILLPAVKLAILFRAWNGDRGHRWAHRHLGWLNALGKWSMLDVFVVAILIASVKLGALASIEIHYGLYAFSAAVVLIMVATQIVHKRALRE
jgi:paraquat-inducible protein A